MGCFLQTLYDIVAVIAAIVIAGIIIVTFGFICILLTFGFMLPPYLSMFVHSLFGQAVVYNEFYRRMDKIDIVCFVIGICISIFVCYKLRRSENPTEQEKAAAIAEHKKKRAEYKAAKLQRLIKEQENRKRKKEEEERLNAYIYIKLKQRNHVERNTYNPVSAPSPIVEKVVVEKVVVKESPSYFILKCPNCMAIINNDNLCCEHCATKVRKAA